MNLQCLLGKKNLPISGPMQFKPVLFSGSAVGQSKKAEESKYSSFPLFLP